MGSRRGYESDSTPAWQRGLIAVGTHVRVDGDVKITGGTAAARPGAASRWMMCFLKLRIIRHRWRGSDCDGHARPFPGLDHHNGGRPLGARLPAGPATPIWPASRCRCCYCRLQLLSGIQQVLDDASVQLQPGGIIHRLQARLLHVRGHSDKDVRLDPRREVPHRHRRGLCVARQADGHDAVRRGGSGTQEGPERFSWPGGGLFRCVGPQADAVQLLHALGCVCEAHSRVEAAGGGVAAEVQQHVELLLARGAAGRWCPPDGINRRAAAVRSCMRAHCGGRIAQAAAQHGIQRRGAVL